MDENKNLQKPSLVKYLIAIGIILAVGVTVIFLIKSESESRKAENAVAEEDTSQNETPREETPQEETIPEEIPQEQPEPKEEQMENLDVEAAVEQIRSWYYSPTYREEKFVLKNGTDGWGYSREYYFHDQQLYFVFMYDGTEEHRFYFKDDVMIRYIDEYKNIYDYGNTQDFLELEKKILEESKQFY